MPNAHVVVEIKGSDEAKTRFNRLLTFADPDWPYAEARNPTPCKQCGGFTYKAPRVSAKDIKAFGELVGLDSVKIRRYAPEEKCEKMDVVCRR